MRSLAERRAKYFAMRDVAGMLRSLEYAAVTATKTSSVNKAVVEGVAREMARKFTAAYLKSIGDSPAFPRDLTEANNLLQVSVIEKAVYEVNYEIANRPDWVEIPVSSLLAFLNADYQMRFVGTD
jgi:maltose alpha-D-glucosyltransferase/alpha-amylase